VPDHVDVVGATGCEVVVGGDVVDLEVLEVVELGDHE
jgi:hypothetical protein